MSENKSYEYKYQPRSLFWPVLLIGLGVVFLLQNLGYLETINIRLLFRLWPLLIVAAGLNLLFRRIPWFGSFLGAALAAIAIAFLAFAPQLNLPEYQSSELKTEYFSEAADGAETLRAHIDIDYGQLIVDELIDSTDLITVDVAHRDTFDWIVSGGSERNVTARLEVIDFFNTDAWFSVDEVYATFLISPGVPLDFDLDMGSGTADLDLSAFDLTSFEADTGAGTLTVSLPSGEYPIDISSGAGTMDLSFASEAIIDMAADIGAGRVRIDLGSYVSGFLSFDIGSGTVEIHVPEGVGVQIDSDTGVGSVRVPSGYERISGSNNNGVWQSPNYDDSEIQLIINLDLGAGTVVITD